MRVPQDCTQLDFFNPWFSSIPQMHSHYFCLHIMYHHENCRHPLTSPLNAPPTLNAMTPPQYQWMTTPFPIVRPTDCTEIHRGCRLIKKFISTQFKLWICCVCCRLSREQIVLWSLIENFVLVDWRLCRHLGALSLTVKCLPKSRKSFGPLATLIVSLVDCWLQLCWCIFQSQNNSSHILQAYLQA